MSWVAAIPLLGKVVERLIPDPDQAAKAKNQLVDMAVKGELDELAQRAGVIKAEAQGDGWLQRVLAAEDDPRKVRELLQEELEAELNAVASP